jgi:hypothetical protein
MIWKLIGFLSGFLYFLGRRSAKADAKVEELTGYVETRQRMDEVDAGDDPAVLREWLRERGKR